MAKVFLGQLAAPATKLYVAPGGTGDGSIDIPFGSLVDARDAIRAMPRPLTNRVEVLLREGTYREPITFLPEDSGESGKTITYKGYPGESATVTAFKQVTGAWQDHTDPTIKKISLPGQVDFRTLSVNGVQAIRARWPSLGDYHVCDTFPGDENATGAVKRFDYFLIKPEYGLPPGILSSEDVETVFYDEYIVHRNLYDPIASNGAEVWIKDQPTARSFNLIPGYNRYWWENSLSFLTDEGEFYYDPGNQVLYYKLRAGEDINTALVEFSTDESVIRLDGETYSFPSMQSDFTFSLWFKTSDSRVHAFFSNIYLAEKPDELFIGLEQNTGGRLYIKYGSPTGIGKAYYSTTGGLIDGNWHHVAVSIDRTSNVVQAFVDGVETTFNTTPDINPALTVEPDFPRLFRSSTTTTFFNGLADSLVCLGQKITEAEAVLLMNRQYGTFDIELNLPLNGDFNFVAKAIKALPTETLYGDSSGLPYHSNPKFVSDADPNHSTTCAFNGVRDSIAIPNNPQVNEYPGVYVEYINFSGLSITGAARPQAASHWGTIDSEPNMFMQGAIDINWGSHIKIENCEIFNTGSDGVNAYVSEYVTVRNCKIHDIGGVGIHHQGIRYQVEQKRWEHHDFLYNEIFNVGRITMTADGIAIYSTGNTKINNNHVYDVTRCGVKSFNELNTLEYNRSNVEIGYNRLRNTSQEVVDNGAIHTCGAVHGQLIHHNNIKDVLLLPAHEDYLRGNEAWHTAIRGVYMDMGAAYMTVENNLVVNCDYCDIYMLNTGPGNTVQNNKFVDSGQAQAGLVYYVTTNAKFGGDGTFDQLPTGNDMFRNICFSGDGTTAPWKHRAVSDLIIEDQLRAIDPVGPITLGVLDSNVFWPELFRHTYNRDLDDIPDTDDKLTLVEYQSDAWYRAGANSIIEANPFVDYANGDFTVTNPVVLAVGFVDFEVPAWD